MRVLDGAITFLLLCSVVIGIRSIGVILMSGMLIAPAAAARQFTNKLSKLICLSALFGALSGFLGIYFSVLIPLRLGGRFSLPTGPVILIVAFIFCLLSLLFSPKKGVVMRLFRMSRFRFRCHYENILKIFWKCGPERALMLSEIAEWSPLRRFPLRVMLLHLERKGLIKKSKKNTFLLSSYGRKRAARLIRLHRLWELYLVRFLNMGEEKVHHSAEEMEHILTPEIEAHLSTLLHNPRKDPHNKPIPLKGETL